MSGVPSVTEALVALERFTQEEAAGPRAEMVDVDQEIANLETALANLKVQLDALQRHRAELDAQVRAVESLAVERGCGALYDALLAQRELLQLREAAVAQAEAARRATLPELIGSGPIGSLVTEYEQFRTAVEPTLLALPESYRAVVLKHHQSVTDRLKDHLAKVVGDPVQVDAEELPVEVAYAFDAPGGPSLAGEPVGLTVLLPVPEEVHGRWAERPDGLGLWIASRVVQAVYEAAGAVDFPQAQVVAGGHRGLLVIEVDLTGAPAGFSAALESGLAGTLSGSAELVGARVAVVPRRVPIDYVIPPEPPEPPAAAPPAAPAPQEATHAG